jgi:hypothetical protein
MTSSSAGFQQYHTSMGHSRSFQQQTQPSFVMQPHSLQQAKSLAIEKKDSVDQTPILSMAQRQEK